MTISTNIFRAYDIRGVAERDLHTELVTRLGRAFGTWLGPRPTVAVGRDCRLTSDRIRDDLVSGLIESGAEVIDIGVVPSPMLYFAAHHLGTTGSVIITGSHNPAPDNGFKLMRGKAALHGPDIEALRDLVVQGGDTGPGGGSHRSVDISDAYLDTVCAGLRLGTRRFKIAVDAGNGAAGPIALALFDRLGFDVVPLYCDMDGRFPNHHPDPTVEDNLQDLIVAVRKSGAELGIAFDGDGDRLGAVDNLGRVVWGDQLLTLFGRDVLRTSPGATIIGEVKCSQTLYDQLNAAGGNAIMWKVGHSLIKSKMAETQAALAGEMSGHLFFADRYLGYDDGVYAGARLVELVTKSKTKGLAPLRDTLPETYATPEIRVDCPDSIKFAVVEAVAVSLSQDSEAGDIINIDGVRIKFGDGWGLVRASNTQPALVLRCEARSQKDLERIEHTLRGHIKSAVRQQGLG